MATYKIVSHGGTGLPLNVYGTGTNGVLLLSDANSIACLHLHVIGANRAIFSAFFCAIHYARSGALTSFPK